MAGPTYTYTATTPQAASPMNSTQSEILNNFQAIQELLEVNHVGFNQSTSGKHNLLVMNEQAEDPGTGASDLSLYVKASTDINTAEVFYQYPNDGQVEQLTGTTGTASATDNITSTQVGYVTFPSGFQISWGYGSVVWPTGSNAYNTYPTATIYLPLGLSNPVPTTTGSTVVLIMYLTVVSSTGQGPVGPLCIYTTGTFTPSVSPYTSYISTSVGQGNPGTYQFNIFQIGCAAANIVSASSGFITY